MAVLGRCFVLGVLGLGFALPVGAQRSLASYSGQTPDRLLEKPALLSVHDVSLTEALSRLSESSGVVVAFSPTLLESDRRKVRCSCRDATVAQALDRLLAGTSFRYTVRDGQVILAPAPAATRRADPGAEPNHELTLAGISDVMGGSVPRLSKVEQDLSVSGSVVDRSTRQALGGARVSVAGSTRSTQSDERGQFRITGLSSGEVTLEVVRIGYQRLVQSVRAGDTDVRLGLIPQVVKLDELIVTGTAGGQEVRALGNAVSRINTAALTEIAPQSNVQAILATQVPGLAIQSAGGNVGSGGTFRLRGASSLALASNPLIYVDGVRVDNNQAANSPRALTSGGFIGGDARYAPSRINDLDPEQIQSIEVIKGPAAATLYGTEASNGVIQIITRRGKTGKPEIQITAKQGANWLPHPEETFQSKYYKSAAGAIVEFNLLRNDEQVGFPVSQYGSCPEPYHQEGDRCKGSPFTTGLSSAVNASLSGGTDVVRYFFSGDVEREEGTVSYNWQNKVSTRANITWTPSEKFGTDIGIGFTRSRLRTQAPMNQPIIVGLDFSCPTPGCEPGRNLPTGADGPFRGYQFVLPEALQNRVESYDDLNRVILNSTFRHKPTSWLTHRLTVGADFGDDRLSGLARRSEGVFRTGYFLPNGARALYYRNTAYASADYGATASFKLGKDLGSETSAGAQYYRKRTTINYSSAENLAVSSLETLDAGATRTTSEDYIENKTFGAYVQQQLSWKNRLFLTGALRGDDNSAFGTNFDFVLYPKFSGSWVLSEEPFMKGFKPISTLKLRGAWGRAGQQPDAYVALQTYRPYSGDAGLTGLTSDNFGNPELKPEVGQELELGFDAGLFNDRIGLEVTYYNKKTRDAIIPVSLPPSTGFAGTRLLNLGEIQNKGAEIAANATLYRSRAVTVDLRSSVSFNSNELESLGAGRAALTATQFNQFHVPGFPVASFFARRVVSSTVTNGVATNVMCEGGDVIAGTGNLSRGGGAPMPCINAPQVYMGGVLPTWQGATSLTVAVGSHLQLFGLVDYMGGHNQRQNEVSATFATFRNSKAILEATDPILMGNIANTFDSRLQLGLMRMGYAKFRDLSATYTFNNSLARKFGASRLAVTASAKNLWTVWQSQTDLFGRRMKDPEVRINGTFFAGDPGGLVGNQQDAWPTARRFLFTVRMTL
ncbi:MAG: SusC/RagA family TonB-linked outer membrane protein [Gemmatimonadota bacterium]